MSKILAEGIIKNLSGFSIFFNLMCFIINILTSRSFGIIHVEIPSLRNTGGVIASFDISILTGIIVVVAAIAASALIGAQVLGSGLNDSATGILIRLVSYLIVWILASSGTLTILTGLGGTYAWLIYGLLTFFYILNIASGVTTSEAAAE